MWEIGSIVWGLDSGCTLLLDSKRVHIIVRELKPMDITHDVEIFLAASLGREKQDAMTFASWGVGEMAKLR